MSDNYLFKVPEEKKVRYIIHTDCKNEADDQFTVVHALLTQKFDVKGIIAGHFNKSSNTQFEKGTSAQMSYDEIKKLLQLMDLTEEYPVYLGSPYEMKDASTPIVSDGAKFIIEEAMKDDPRPLYIGMQGAITDLASAILLEPEICNRMTCIWVGGGDYPNGGNEFNLRNDIIAANIVFQSNMPVWQIPKSTYRQMAVSLSELQVRVRPYGAIGKYLFEQMIQFNDQHIQNKNWPHGELWALGDEGCIAVLMSEAERTDIYEEITAPAITDDMQYVPGTTQKKIRVYKHLDVRLVIEDLYAKLMINYLNEEK